MMLESIEEVRRKVLEKESIPLFYSLDMNIITRLEGYIQAEMRRVE